MTTADRQFLLLSSPDVAGHPDNKDWPKRSVDFNLDRRGGEDFGAQALADSHMTPEEFRESPGVRIARDDGDSSLDSAFDGEE